MEVHDIREVKVNRNVDVHVPVFNVRPQAKTVNKEVIRTVQKPVFTDIRVDLVEVRSRTLKLRSEIPKPVEIIEHMEVEYIVQREKPVPVEEVVEIQIPRFTKNINVKEIERPVRVL